MNTTVARATALGSWPGTDVQQAQRVVLGLLGTAAHLPHLPELPGRGPGADLLGRGAAVLVDLPVDLQPSGWRLVDHPGRDLTRARAWLRQDLDVLAEVAHDYHGPIKLQVTGPWTLAAHLLLPRLERVVLDPGACRDLVASLAEGVSQHVREVSRLLPGRELVLQLDEPSLPQVLTGSLPTASGFGRLRSVAAPVVQQGVGQVLQAAREAGAATTVLHCCADSAPLSDLLGCGAQAIALDVRRLPATDWEHLAHAHEAGTQIWAGVLGVDEIAGQRPDTLAERALRPWTRLGMPAAEAAQLVLTPACGLAGASPTQARQALELVVAAAGALAETVLG